MTVPTRRRLVASAGAAFGALLLPGCATIRAVTGDPPELFALTPKSTFDENLPMVDWQLLVETPSAAAGLNTVRIAVRETPFQLAYYATVQWSARAPEMIETLIVESFENSGRIVAVGRDAIGLRGNYILKTELREFQAETFDGANPKVRVRINAKLVRIPERTIVASETFERVEPARSNRFGDIIATFDDMTGKVLRRLVEWTLRQGEADHAAR